MTGKEGTMSCAEFQKELPYMFESGGEIRHEHLNTCEDCSSLVQDLRYIADQAKLLLPMHDPSPRVWNNIQTSLSKDGIIASEQQNKSGHNVAAQKKNSALINLGWAAAVAAAVLLAFALFQTSRSGPSSAQLAGDSQTDFIDQDDDSQLLAGVEQQAPALKPAYEAGLRDVNQYISDAQATLAEDPNDDEAKVFLREAYAQKAMLYRMGTARSLNEIPAGQ